jgi:hypothetical protein
MFQDAHLAEGRNSRRPDLRTRFIPPRLKIRDLTSPSYYFARMDRSMPRAWRKIHVHKEAWRAFVSQVAMRNPRGLRLDKTCNNAAVRRTECMVG